jgi:hypothetical protein
MSDTDLHQPDLGPLRALRPALAGVHCAASGQLAQGVPTKAIRPDPPRAAVQWLLLLIQAWMFSLAAKGEAFTGQSDERRDSSRATSRNGTIRYTAIPKYSATAATGKASPMRIAITYPMTMGRSFRRSVCTSSSSWCGE